MGILFGPVPSRRYGISLGLDIIPKKTCSFNCLFCEVGETNFITSERNRFSNLEELIPELDEFFRKNIKIDVITFAGSGEPTLNYEIGRMIRYLKNKYYWLPVVVLTNGSLLWMKEVREELSIADIVEPSLNAGDEDTFIRISRPEKNIIFPLYIEGLIKFREEFKGRYFLEVFFVKGVNDNEKNVKKIKGLIEKINPHLIHLNTIDRPPALNFEPVSLEFLLWVKNVLGNKAKIISHFKHNKINIEIKELVLKTIKVRPLKINDIYTMINLEKETIDKAISELKENGIIKEEIFNGEKYIQGL